jgi:VanZ family protein
VPLGASAYLALRRNRVLKILAPIAIGLVLSASIEMIQLFTPHRVCSAVDLVNNVIGSALGVIAGIVFSRIVDVPLTFHVRDRNSVGLIFCWVAFLLFPLFPVLSLSVWRAKVSAFHGISPIPTMLSAAEWFAVGRLVDRPLVLLGLFLLIPIQFGIVNHDPMPADFLGAAMGALLYYYVRKQADRVAAIALLSAVTLRGLAPFHFEGAQDFLWIPFGGMLAGEWQNSVLILLGKLFQYGASIWLLHRSGLSLVRATAITAALLASIEGLQTRIPGHIAEVTDPLLAVLLGLALYTQLSATSDRSSRHGFY